MKQNSVSGRFRFLIKTRGSVVIFLVLWIAAMIIVPRFATMENTLLIVRRSAIPLICCLGMTLVLMTGGIDLSLGYTAGISSVIVGILIKTMGMPALPAVVLTLLAGCAIGLLNGFVVQVVKVPAFITTLCTGYIIFGLARIVSLGRDINGLPASFLAIGRSEFWGINTTVLIAISICLVLNRSDLLVYLQMGASRIRLRTPGFETQQHNYRRRTIFLVYVACAVFASMAGILLAIHANSAYPTMGGADYTLEILAAALCGASFFGGTGIVLGSVFGVLTIKAIENCIILVEGPVYIYQTAQGIVILFVMIFETIKNRKGG